MYGNRFEQSSGPTRFLIIVLSPVYTSIDVYVQLLVEWVKTIDLHCEDLSVHCVN